MHERLLANRPDARLALLRELEKREQRSVWGVLREDTYETVFGDGYYAYLTAAFFTEEEANASAAENGERSVNWHIREYQLYLAEGELAVTALPKSIERHPWTPGNESFVPTLEQEPIDIETFMEIWKGDGLQVS